MKGLSILAVVDMVGEASKRNPLCQGCCVGARSSTIFSSIIANCVVTKSYIPVTRYCEVFLANDVIGGFNFELA